ncbi:MAG TPA: hypothetical protein VGL53_18390 [Bryobacteraceae bacterium]
MKIESLEERHWPEVRAIYLEGIDRERDVRGVRAGLGSLECESSSAFAAGCG